MSLNKSVKVIKWKWHHSIDRMAVPIGDPYLWPCLYHFRDKARYRSKIAIFVHTPPVYDPPPVRWVPVRIFS